MTVKNGSRLHERRSRTVVQTPTSDEPHTPRTVRVRWRVLGCYLALVGLAVPAVWHATAVGLTGVLLLSIGAALGLVLGALVRTARSA